MSRELIFSKAIQEAFAYCLTNDPGVRIFGLGVPDPKGVFGTTLGLQKSFGKNRVFDIPLSENAITGMALGLGISGLRPVMNHQRADFSFTSMEQIVNQVSKLAYTTNNVLKSRLTIRMIVGRGWGQGPTHAQSPQGMFASVPGLRVVMPATPEDGYWLTRHSIESDDPVILIEHRWLHHLKGTVDMTFQKLDLSQAEVLTKGEDVTLISMSYGVIECMKLESMLRRLGISATVINLRSISPIDFKTILYEVEHTKRAMVLDTSHVNFGVSSEISSVIHETLFDVLLKPCLRMGNKFEPTPSAPLLAKSHYPDLYDILEKMNSHFDFGFDSKEIDSLRMEIEISKNIFRDQPEIGEVGPF